MKKIIILMLVAVSALAFIGIESKAFTSIDINQISNYNPYETTNTFEYENVYRISSINVTTSTSNTGTNSLFSTYIKTTLYKQMGIYIDAQIDGTIVKSHKTIVTKTSTEIKINFYIIRPTTELEIVYGELSINPTSQVINMWNKVYPTAFKGDIYVDILPGNYNEVIGEKQNAINDIYENGLGGYYYIDDEYDINFQIITSDTYDYGAGYAQAMAQEEFSFWEIALSSVMLPFTILSIELMPGLPIGIFALIPIVFGLIAFFFSFKGGEKIMTFENLGMQLWNFILMIAGFMGDIWVFLTSERVIGEIAFFGITITEGFTFTPIALGLPVIIAIVTAGLISLFSPI